MNEHQDDNGFDEQLEETVEDIADTGKQVTQQLKQTRRSAFQRFPLLFTLLGAFGFVATLEGMRGILKQIPLIAQNPYIVLVIGLAILIGTGQLYKHLS